MSCSLSNPDVSGVGVRAAIYAQNLTCFLSVIVHLWDRKISRDELKGVKDQSIGMLAVAFAILLTTIILAKGGGGDQQITSYHAAVVLDLSWMNNTSTWIWFTLYVHHRSKRDNQPTGAHWSEWYDALLEPVQKLLGRKDETDDRTYPDIIGRHITQRTWRIAQRIWHFISVQPVLTLGSIHLSLMAAVGIWLWIDPYKFGQSLDGCDPTLTVVGAPAHFSSKPLRIASLAMYSLVLIPVINLIPPFTFFLGLHITYNQSRERHLSFWMCIDKALGGFSNVLRMALDAILHVLRLRRRPTSDIERQIVNEDANEPISPSTSNPSPRTAFLIVGLVLLVAINILFIVNIELTLRRNKGEQNNDNQWGFGQVLALLLLIIPLRDTWGALQEIQEKIQQRLKGFREQFEELLQREFHSAPVAKRLGQLVQKRVPNPTLWEADSRFGNALQLVAFYGKVDLLKLLLTRGIQDTPGEHFQTALQSAAAGGNVHMVQFLLHKRFEDKPGGYFQTTLQSAAMGGHLPMMNFLLGMNKYMEGINEVGGDYGTALCAACAHGKVEVVKALLGARARRNLDGGEFGGPLHVAVLMDNREMVELLIDKSPGDADFTWGNFGNAVDVAGFLENERLYSLLRQKGLE
ncbi:ankyrin repeat-containing domain protein, partial [Mycena metata]